MGAGMNVRRLVQLAVLAAISVVLVYFIHFPLFPAAPFLIYDPADIPLILATFLFGPVSGLVLTLVTCVVQEAAFPQSGIVGIIMHFCATGSYCLLAGYIFGRKRDMAGAVVAMLAGICAMTLLMIALNLVVTPLFMSVPVKAVADMILPVLLPFNLIKAGVNSVLAFVVFKSVGKFLMRMAGERSNPGNNPERRE